jgi:hypothetical protein
MKFQVEFKQNLLLLLCMMMFKCFAVSHIVVVYTFMMVKFSKDPSVLLTSEIRRVVSRFSRLQNAAAKFSLESKFMAQTNDGISVLRGHLNCL